MTSKVSEHGTDSTRTIAFRIFVRNREHSLAVNATDLYVEHFIVSNDIMVNCENQESRRRNESMTLITKNIREISRQGKYCQENYDFKTLLLSLSLLLLWPTFSGKQVCLVWEIPIHYLRFIVNFILQI